MKPIQLDPNKNRTNPLLAQIVIIFLTLNGSVSESLAQGAYRCNVNGKVVYQDTSCVATPRAVGDVSANVGQPSANPINDGKILCQESGPKFVTWKDPDSLKVGAAIGGKMTVLDYANTKVGAREYFVPVNAKNGYGGYIGEKMLACYTSQDGKRILKIDDILIR